jgi:hypothetical protein
MIYTSTDRADAFLAQLILHKEEWLKVSLTERIGYLEGCLNNVSDVAQQWAETACNLKGLDPNSAIAGEEWLAGPFAVMHYLRLLIRTLKAGDAGNPPLEQRLPDRQIARVANPKSSPRLWARQGCFSSGGWQYFIYCAPGCLAPAFCRKPSDVTQDESGH